jgi:uncharacterized protein DUF5681
MSDKPRFYGPLIPGPTPKITGRWKPGESGNPAGRPKGARHRLGETFLKDLKSKWDEKGAEVLDRVIEEKPDVFLRVVAAIIPQHLELEAKVPAANEAQLNAVITAVKAEIARRAAAAAPATLINISPDDIAADNDDDDDLIS